MSKEILTKSEKFKPEYSCRIHKIGDVTPIEGTDFLATTMIGGDFIVVRKDTTKPGDILFYVTRENVIDTKFLYANSEFLFDKRELNANYQEVEALISESEKIKDSEPEKSAELLEKAKRMSGYFGENGRVRAKVLRGTLSSGYLFPLESMLKYKPELKEYFDEHPLSEFINEDGEEFMFDTVDGTLFVWPYIPKVQTPRGGSSRTKKNKDGKRIKKFNRIDDTHFAFHYDTLKMGDNIWRIKPDDVVDISIKEHGTSIILANIITNVPISLPFYKRIYNKIVDNIGLKKYRITDSYQDYGNVYSSRKVIQNGTIDLKENPDEATYYGHNVYRDINDIFKDFIPRGYTIYGEVVGYVSENGKEIQKHYNYGCLPTGKGAPVNKLMIYRVLEETPDGKKKEFTVSEVIEFSKNLLEQLPEENKNRLEIIPVLYHGTLKDLYPEISTESHWHENVLLAMKTDVEHFGMEGPETLCIGPKKKLPPREGVVVRVEVPHEPCEVVPPMAQDAFKLKTDAFAKKEAEAIDKGEVDMEMAGTDYAGPSDSEKNTES